MRGARLCALSRAWPEGARSQRPTCAGRTGPRHFQRPAPSRGHGDRFGEGKCELADLWPVVHLPIERDRPPDGTQLLPYESIRSHSHGTWNGAPPSWWTGKPVGQIRCDLRGYGRHHDLWPAPCRILRSDVGIVAFADLIRRTSQDQPGLAAVSMLRRWPAISEAR
jgi:hypothetical protein